MQKMAKKTILLFEVRCSHCGFLEFWGVERAVRALVTIGKLSPQSDFDAILFAELFVYHIDDVFCPHCREVGTLSVKRAQPNSWEWEDAIRCEDCGHEIPQARLEALPGTTRCVSCQRELDEQA